MIFNSNTTSLNTSNVVMAEGYDCSYGPALALVEAAEMDYKMFCAMLNVDAYEMQIRRESANYVAESQIISITEATIGEIWSKIADFFKSLAEKLKAMFSTLWSKISKIWMNDKKYLETYKDDAKKAPSDLKIKWVTYKKTIVKDVLIGVKMYTREDGWVEDKKERIKYFLGCATEDYDKTAKAEYIDGDGKASEKTLKDIGGIDAVIDYISKYGALFKDYTKKCNNLVAQSKKYSEEAKKNIAAEKKYNVDSDKGNESGVETAKKAYDMAQAYHDALMIKIKWANGAIKQEYKQNKAAFMKAVAAGKKPEKKSTEETTAEAAYLDAIGEAAEQEVDDIIDSTISKEKFAELNKAGLDITDSDVSNDPDALTYSPDKYTDDLYGTKVGTIDTEINSKEESAFFGRLFY